MLVYKNNLSKESSQNIKLFLQKQRTVGSLSKLDFLKLQMRYVDGHEVAINSTKKPFGGTELQLMQLTWKQKAWKQWKSGESKDKYLKVKRAVKEAVYFAKKKMLRLKRLLVSTTIAIRIEFSKWHKG